MKILPILCCMLIFIVYCSALPAELLEKETIKADPLSFAEDEGGDSHERDRRSFSFSGEGFGGFGYGGFGGFGGYGGYGGYRRRPYFGGYRHGSFSVSF